MSICILIEYVIELIRIFVSIFWHSFINKLGYLYELKHYARLYGGKMRDFSRNKKRFGRRGSDRFDSSDSGGRFGRRDFDRPGRSSEQRMMHEATCDKCGNKCEVPFKPTGGKPVYCSDCFRKNGYPEPRGSPNSSSGELEQINEKLDKILKALKIN